MKAVKKMLAMLLVLSIVAAFAQPVMAAEVPYLPDVSEEMTDYRFWAQLQDDADELILTMEEIEAFNQDTIDASGTMVMDIKAYPETFDGLARIEALKSSSTADAQYYFGWTYDPADGELADWSYYQQMIDNVVDPNATSNMPYRYGVAVNRTVLKAFPSDNPIWDDPADVDFDYQSISAVRVNEPVLIYTTSADGEYYLARIDDCSGWIAARDVAICQSKEEWLSAWDLPSEDLLVVYGNKIYTETSYYAPETSRKLLTQGTALELVKDIAADQNIINRYPYHNYVVYLPVRLEDGSYDKQMALISETAEVSVGYLPLTKENIAMVALENLGDTYGWGGMLDVEDCSGQVRTIYSCFGLEIARNGNWQWKMNIEKVDMSYMSIEEKCLILDELPLGAALCFPGHEMIYLGKYEGKYYVISSVGSIMNPVVGGYQRVRSVIINTLDLKRANGQTWMQALNQAFMPCYPTINEKTYEDFPQTQWYRDGVYYCLKNGLISNYDNGRYGPGDDATRSTAVSALWRLDGKPEVSSQAQFADVPAEGSAYRAACWAFESGVSCGYGGGTFGWNNIVTREQLATMLWRYAQYKGYDVSIGEDTNILSYDDAFTVSSYAVSAMQWACGAGLLQGRTGENGEGMILDPKSATTRAQLSVILMRFGEWMETAELLPVYHTVDLAQGELIISAGAEEYAAYMAESPLPENAPAPAYISQDGGATWTKLTHDLRIITSEPSENGIVSDPDAPYGDLTIMLDGVNTTGNLELSPCGQTTICVKGEVQVGTVVTGLNQTMRIQSADDKQSNSLTVTAPEGYGLVADRDIVVENLSALHITTGKEGIYSESGSITVEGTPLFVQAGEGFAALRSNNADGVITINGSVVSEAAGSTFSSES